MVCQICQNQTTMVTSKFLADLTQVTKWCPLTGPQTESHNFSDHFRATTLARPQLISHSAAPGEVYLVGIMPLAPEKLQSQGT